MQREYPAAPIASVAVAVRREDRLLLTRRKYEPRRGRWVLPGGVIELGESVHQAARREIREECGIEIEIQRVIDVEDRIFHDEAGRVQYHYILIILWAEHRGGTLVPASDIDAAEWVREGDLESYDIPNTSIRSIRQAFRAVRGEDRPSYPNDGT